MFYAVMEGFKLLRDELTLIIEQNKSNYLTTDGKRKIITGFTSYVIISNFVTKNRSANTEIYELGAIFLPNELKQSYSDYNGNPYN